MNVARAEAQAVRAGGFLPALNRSAIYACLVLAAIFFLLPLFVMLVTSFKSLAEIRTGSIMSLPSAFGFGTWSEAWDSACVGVNCIGLKGFYARTFLMVVPAVLLSTVIGAFNGFALTKFAFPYSRLVFGIIMFGCFTPYQGVIVPLARMLGFIGLAGTLKGLVLVHTVYGIPFTTMFFRNFYVTVPQDLVRAARVDGAGFFRIFWSIMLPISRPIFVVSVIWQFTGLWNDYLFGVSFTTGENTPIMAALNNMVSTSQGEKPWNVDMAAAVLTALPTLIIYLLAGKYFVRGLMAGSVKG